MVEPKRQSIKISLPLTREAFLHSSDFGSSFYGISKQAYQFMLHQLQQAKIFILPLLKVQEHGSGFDNYLQYIVNEAIKNALDSLAERYYDSNGKIRADALGTTVNIELVAKMGVDGMFRLKIKDQGISVKEHEKSTKFPLEELIPSGKDEGMLGGQGVGVIYSTSMLLQQYPEARLYLKNRKESGSSFYIEISLIPTVLKAIRQVTELEISKLQSMWSWQGGPDKAKRIIDALSRLESFFNDPAHFVPLFESEQLTPSGFVNTSEVLFSYKVDSQESLQEALDFERMPNLDYWVSNTNRVQRSTGVKAKLK